jgi:predicted 2-oxoglutarate/Fe(II)-dependent dioxygenase YbiX
MQNVSWTDLPRLEKTNSRLPDEIFDGTLVKNLSYGINLYKNIIPKEQCKDIINILEDKISNSENTFYWKQAQINNKENNIDSRNCFDFKYKREHLGNLMPYDQKLFDIHKTVEDYLNMALGHYQKSWNLFVNYKEAFNFVKYGPNQYFKIHGDHGPHYTCTVSAVVYLNDDYEGGEIDFIRQELKIKPSVGDIVLFPSNYVYEHASCEVTSGTKYSVVIMLDYNDKYHKDNV